MTPKYKVAWIGNESKNNMGKKWTKFLNFCNSYWWGGAGVIHFQVHWFKMISLPRFTLQTDRPTDQHDNIKSCFRSNNYIFKCTVKQPTFVSLSSMFNFTITDLKKQTRHLTKPHPSVHKFTKPQSMMGFLNIIA